MLTRSDAPCVYCHTMFTPKIAHAVHAGFQICWNHRIDTERLPHSDRFSRVKLLFEYLLLQFLNNCAYSWMFIPLNTCRLFPFPLTTKARCRWVFGPVWQGYQHCVLLFILRRARVSGPHFNGNSSISSEDWTVLHRSVIVGLKVMDRIRAIKIQMYKWFELQDF